LAILAGVALQLPTELLVFSKKQIYSTFPNTSCFFVSAEFENILLVVEKSACAHKTLNFNFGSRHTFCQVFKSCLISDVWQTLAISSEQLAQQPRKLFL